MRKSGFEVFDDWFAAGEEADDKWRDYEKARGRTYQQALEGYAANHVFSFDLHHLDSCDCFVLCAPAGKSTHTELGYVKGRGKPTFYLLDDPERWDVMVKFADHICFNEEELLKGLDAYRQIRTDTSAMPAM